MVKSVQVADALDDAGLDDWINTAAGRLTQYAHCHEETDDLTPHQIADSLSALSSSLQIRLFVRVTRDARKLHSLLDFLPSHIHHALVAASITPAKVLEIPLHDNSLPFVKAVSANSPPPASILSLSVRVPKDSPMQGEAWREAAGHLSQALQHHSTITSLRLDVKHMDAASAQLFTPAISTLTSMQSLYLHTGINTDTSTALQQTLQALPQLEDLSLSLILAPDSRKRQRDVSTAGTAPCCLAALLSPATKLTSLWLFAQADGGNECYTAANSLVLPFLMQLSLKFEQLSIPIDSRCTHYSHTIASSCLLSHLAAPLTSLDLRDGFQYAALRAEDTPHAQRFFSSLANFEQLRHLSITAPQGYHMRCVAITHAVTAAAPPALAALPHLQYLNFDAELPSVLASLPMLAGATELSHLRLKCQHRHNHPQAALMVSPDDWEQLFSGLSRLSLASLEVDGCLAMLPGITRLSLRDLTRLSALRATHWECLRTRADIDALSSMTHLRKLHLIGSAVPEGMHARCVRGIAALSALTDLALQVVDSSDTIVSSLIKYAPAGAWPQLRQLSLDVWPPSAAPAAVFGFASGLPALTRLVLDLPDALPTTTSGADDDPDEEALAEEAAFSRDVAELAAQADFAVEYLEEFPF